ncbi:hypothetical protein GF380_01060 [Candidatus Uhrbacteria bacterium]|nr:hypothetical protein [Candidatus Uhrbacteria bacterium]
MAVTWYSDRDPDLPWWYNERATLSTFAGAIWLSGGVAFEEFTCHRSQDLYSKRASSESNGRADMYFYIENDEFLVEAKQCWCKPELDFDSTIEEAFNSAEKQLTTLVGEDGQRTVVVFACPSIPDRGRDQARQLLDNWTSKAKEVNCTISCLITLDEFEHALYNGRYYPGIALFIRTI